MRAVDRPAATESWPAPPSPHAGPAAPYRSSGTGRRLPNTAVQRPSPRPRAQEPVRAERDDAPLWPCRAHVNSSARRRDFRGSTTTSVAPTTGDACAAEGRRCAAGPGRPCRRHPLADQHLGQPAFVRARYPRTGQVGHHATHPQLVRRTGPARARRRLPRRHGSRSGRRSRCAGRIARTSDLAVRAGRPSPLPGGGLGAVGGDRLRLRAGGDPAKRGLRRRPRGVRAARIRATGRPDRAADDGPARRSGRRRRRAPAGDATSSPASAR